MLYLLAVRAPHPPRALWGALAASALGTVVGFPLGLVLAVREVRAMHAAVVTGVLPLATVLVAAIATRQWPSAGFWACALLGCALVLAFAAWQGGGGLSVADGWLLLAVLSAAIGYVAGTRGSGVAGAVGHLLGAGGQPAADPAAGAGAGAGAGRSAGPADRPTASRLTARFVNTPNRNLPCPGPWPAAPSG